MGINYSYKEFIEVLKNIDNHFDGEEETEETHNKKEEKSIVSSKKFKEYCSNEELPIIARNCLIGTGNLWYEQVLPQKSVFGTVIVAPSKIQTTVNVTTDIYETVKKTFNNKVIQIGANATIGYGYCKLTNIKEVEK